MIMIKVMTLFVLIVFSLKKERKKERKRERKKERNDQNALKFNH